MIAFLKKNPDVNIVSYICIGKDGGILLNSLQAISLCYGVRAILN